LVVYQELVRDVRSTKYKSCGYRSNTPYWNYHIKKSRAWSLTFVREIPVRPKWSPGAI